MLTALCHSDETGWTEVADLDRISDLRADPATLVWGEIDMTRLGPADIDTIAREFDLDAMAVEDALKARQRPKLEGYDKHRFAVLHQLYEADGQLEKRQISCFVADDFLLVIHEGAGDLIAGVRRRLTEAGPEAEGALGLLYVLLDNVVDEYGSLADALEENIEAIEDSVVGGARDRVRREASARTDRRRIERVQLQLYSVKQQIARLRRYGLPLERVLLWLVDGRGSNLVSARDSRLFRDVLDHTLRIAEQVHNVDALAQAVLDLNRAEQSADLNESNKKLTGWAAIVAVPTVIAGIYGMNYRLWPADGTARGFWIALAVMAATAVSLYSYFKNRGWL
jgi:magnesium transporter